MATLTLRDGQNPVSFVGADPVPFTSLDWINPTNIVEIYTTNSTGAGYTKYTPGSRFGPQSFAPAPSGTIAGYVVVTKRAVQVEATLFVADTTIPPPNDRNDFDKGIRYWLKADRDANIYGGLCFGDLNPTKMAIGTIIHVEFYRPTVDAAMQYNVDLVARYDENGTIFVAREGNFDTTRVPASFAVKGSTAAAVAFRRYQLNSQGRPTITNWNFAEVCLYDNGSGDKFFGAQRSGNLGVPNPAADTADWKRIAVEDLPAGTLFEPIAETDTHPGFTDQNTLNRYLLGQQTGGGTPTPTPTPTIASFSPGSGAVDSTVTIAGANFGATAGTVKFNDILANLITWGDTSIQAKVPTGGATGRIKVTTAAGDSVTSTGTFTATVPGTPTTLYPQAADFSGNSYNEATSVTGFRRYSSLAGLQLSTNAPYIDVEVLVNVNNQFAPNQGVVVLDANNTLIQKLVSATKTAPSTVRVTLSGQQQTLNIVLPDVGNGETGADGTNLLFGTVRSIVIPAGSTGSIVAPAAPARRLYAINDSIFNGAGVDTPQVDGVAPRLKALIPGLGIGIDGWNGRQSTEDYVGVLGRAQAYLDGATTKWILIELGTNDKLSSARTPTDCATRVVNLAAYLRDNVTGSPKLLVQTPLSCQDETGTNNLGYKMSDYRAAIIAAVNSAPNVMLVDGTAILDPASGLSDPYHPNAQGNSDYADYLQGVLLPESVSQPYQLSGRQYIKLPGTAAAVSATSFSLAFMMSVNESQLVEGHVWAMRKGSFTVKNYGGGGDTQTWRADGSEGPSFGGGSPLLEADHTYFVGVTLGDNGSVWIVGNNNPQTSSTAFALLQNTVDAILGARQNNNDTFTDFTAMGVKNVSFWSKQLTVEQLQSLRAVNAKVPASGPLNYNDPSCLIFAPMSASDDNGTFANLAEPSSPLLLATA